MTNLPNIGKPATNALHSIGITSLEQVSLFDKVTLLNLHGMGPKAIAILEQHLAEQNLFFQPSSNEASVPKCDFTVLCSLDCDNAPKRRLIRDYLIAAISGNQPLLDSMLADSFRFFIPNKKKIISKHSFITLILEKKIAIDRLEIHSILTHGKEGATHGTITTKTGNTCYFSAFIRFKSNQKDALISEITSFIIQ